MKFMKSAEDKKKQQLKAQADLLMDEIDEQPEQKPIFGGTKFGGSKKDAPDLPNQEDIMKAAQAMHLKHQNNPVEQAGEDSQSSSSSDDDLEVTSNEGDEQALMNLIKGKEVKKAKPT